MNFTPEKNVVRTLIIRSGDYSSDPVQFSVPLSFNEPEFDHCYIKLKQFLLDESTTIQQDSVLKSIYVQADLGQKVYDSKSRRNYLGSLHCEFTSDNYFKISEMENPLIELPNIPHGVYNFKVTDVDGDLLTVNDGQANQDISAHNITLVFELYFCKRKY